jgi:hypothetical protein
MGNANSYYEATSLGKLWMPPLIGDKLNHSSLEANIQKARPRWHMCTNHKRATTTTGRVDGAQGSQAVWNNLIAKTAQQVKLKS